MYTLFCIIISFGSLALFIYGCVITDWNYIASGLVIYFTHPIFNETILNIYDKIIYSEEKYQKKHLKKHNKFIKYEHPLLYSQKYNMTACGLERLHPFDSCKYKKIVNGLMNYGIIKSIDQIYEPEKASRSTLTITHSRWYLFTLCYSINVCRIIEIPLLFLPACILRWKLLDSMLCATQGSIDGACMALTKKWAINLSGGYHHASSFSGSGFCIYADITLTIKHLFKYHSDKVNRVMIIDLDAHQGNGHERDFNGNNNVFIIDFYNHYIYPGDTEAKRAISVDVTVNTRDDDEVYLKKVENVINESMERFKPDFILYNAGTDCLQNDPLGNLNISPLGIIKRDEIVFSFALKSETPILMVLSGGYQQENGDVIANSIKNLYSKFNLESL